MLENFGVWAYVCMCVLYVNLCMCVCTYMYNVYADCCKNIHVGWIFIVYFIYYKNIWV